MPVRSLRSCVLKWPSRTEVLAELKSWVRTHAAKDDTVVRIGCFGSITDDTRWGVGSDLDMIVVVRTSPDRARQTLTRDLTALPVPVDLLVYSEEEWDAMKGRRFRTTVESSGLWLYA